MKAEAQPLMKSFTVTGVAFVPVQVSVDLLAADPASAKRKAARMWENIEERGSMIVPGSADESCAFDFEPSEAAEQPTTPADES